MLSCITNFICPNSKRAPFRFPTVCLPLRNRMLNRLVRAWAIWCRETFVQRTITLTPMTQSLQIHDHTMARSRACKTKMFFEAWSTEWQPQRFSDISTPVKFGKPRGFSRCVKSFVLRARVFEKKKTLCIGRGFQGSQFKRRCSCLLELLWLKIAG